MRRALCLILLLLAPGTAGAGGIPFLPWPLDPSSQISTFNKLILAINAAFTAHGQEGPLTARPATPDLAPHDLGFFYDTTNSNLYFYDVSGGTWIAVNGGSPYTLPPASAGALGGVFSASAPAGQVMTGVDTGGHPTFGAPPALPSVADNATLAAAANATYSSGVMRRDYAAGYGAPPLLFLPQTGTCASNSLVSDGGTCVNSTSGDGNSWKAQPGPEIDWREFGVKPSLSDNKALAQAALDGANRLGLSLTVCGSGTYKLSGTLYFYPTPVKWCNHSAILQRQGAGAVLRLVDAIGHTYPQAPIMAMYLERPTIDLKATLMTTTGGAGIVVTSANNCHIRDPMVFNIPSNATAAPGATGAPVGTWNYTDGYGSGFTFNAGIAELGGDQLNVENCTIEGGSSGNFHIGASGLPDTSASCAATKGAAGLHLGIPSTAIGQSAALPANADIYSGTLYDCNAIGVRDDYGSANRFVNIDTTFSDLVGVAIGTYGRYDLVCGGSTSSSTISVKFGALGLTGSPVTISVTDNATPLALCGELATAINASAALAAYGVTADVWPGTAVVHIDYGDEFQGAPSPGADPGLNFQLCGSNTFPSCSGTVTLKPYWPISWVEVLQAASENAGVAANYVGANVQSYTISDPQQITNSLFVLHNHGGQDGSIVPHILLNTGKNAQSAGTPESSDFTADCTKDPQPYLVDTSSSVSGLTATFSPTAEMGTRCEFVDASSAGSFAAKPLTLAIPNAAWFATTIRHASGLTLNTDFADVALKLVPFNNTAGDWR